MSQFRRLKVNDVRQETENTVSIAFEIPTELKDVFHYRSGQYITVKKEIAGEDVRRAYSLCSAPNEEDFRIGVKKIENGKMSTFLNKKVVVGDELEVMPPIGNFVVDKLSSSMVAFAVGSGITPILAMIKSVLNAGGTATLFYGNRTFNTTIFKNELDRLKDEFPANFNLHYIYSKENIENNLYKGRIDEDKLNNLIKENLVSLKADGYYMCGPEEMVKVISGSLEQQGVLKEKIHFELFTAPTKKKEEKESSDSKYSGESQVTVIMDGDEFDFNLESDGDFILDAAMDAGADVPFSCKGAVCCTCKAQVLEGEAVMEMNYALSEAEVAEGYILTCQAHPASEKIVVDYDVT